MSSHPGKETVEQQSAYNDEATHRRFAISDERIRYWSILDSWTASEAAALILLLDPDRVDSKYIALMPETSVISQKFKDNKRVIERSDELTGDDTPKEIIEALIIKGIPVPEKLQNAVKVHEEASSYRLNLLKVANKKLKNDVEILKKSLNEKRIDSMKKIIAYLSIMTKDYIPGKNSRIHQMVEKDLKDVGVAITHDTVKSVLDDCAEVIAEEGDIDRLIETASKRVKKSEFGKH